MLLFFTVPVIDMETKPSIDVNKAYTAVHGMVRDI